MLVQGGAGGGVPFRTFLPDRTVDSGRIFRDIEGIEGIYQLLGSDPGLDQWRGEMGVIPVHDMQASLGSQLCEIDAVQVAGIAGAANTTATSTFSFPTLPSGGEAAAHRILAATLTVSGVAANFAGADFRAQPFGDPTAVPISIVDGATVTTIAGLVVFADWQPAIRGLWGRREVDYIFRVRSGAGGASTATLQLLVAMVPPGVAVPE